MDHFVIIHPQFDELKHDVEKLRAEIAELVLERDQLKHHECKNIEMGYLRTIGAFEYRVYELECLNLRLKRTIELIQARKNRQERVIIADIEQQLEREFADYLERLARERAKVTAALERGNRPLLTEAESLELKKLHLAVVKELHPDLHPNITEERLHLFHLAVDAYENGDLKGLRAIHIMVTDPSAQAARPDAYEFLIGEKARLLETITHLKREISDIKSSYPYTLKAIVCDSVKSAERQARLDDQIAALNEIVAARRRRIDEMIGKSSE